MTLPLVRGARPYVDYRFEGRRLAEVLQTREGDATRPRGWSDVGLFALSNAGLDGAWARFVATGGATGARTGERNFLPFLGWLAREEGFAVRRLRVSDPAEARGLNTPEDLAWFRAALAARPGRA